jgi:hypothetical protein
MISHFVAEVAKNRKIWNEDKAHMLASSHTESSSVVESSQQINDIEASKSPTPKASTTPTPSMANEQLTEPLTSGRVKDVYIELPGAHHGFNQVINLLTIYNASINYKISN